MLKVNLYSLGKAKAESFNLPIVAPKENLNLLAQAIRVYENRIHPGLAKTKTRAEINKTKKKWYKQKGTGGARHGAKSAPIFVGGGVTHGPDGIKKMLSLPKNLRRKALLIALSLKSKEDSLVAAGGFSKIEKTKEARNLIKKILSDLKKKEEQKVTIFLAQENEKVKRVLKNLDKTTSALFSRANAYDVFTGGIIILDKEIWKEEKKVKKVKKEETK
jgi:large subunit ribosomal protein L4